MFVVNLILTVVVHVCYGFYATLLDWIQSPDHGKMGVFILLVASNLAGLIFFLTLQLIKNRGLKNPFYRTTIFYYLRGKTKSVWFLFFFTSTIWIFASFASVYSFKLAAHPSTIQAITLLMPFVVFFLAKITKIAKTLPRFILPSFVLSVGGCIMMILGSVNKTKEKGDNDAHIKNIISICLAIFFDLSAACFFVLQQKVCKVHKVPAEVLLLTEKEIYVPLALIFSFIFPDQDWNVYKTLGTKGWIYLIYITVGAMSIARFGQAKMVVLIGAALYSSVQGIRLPSTMVSDYVVLKEDPHWPLQYIGAVIVFITISLFLGYQAFADKKTKGKHFVFDPYTFIYIEEDDDEFTMVNPLDEGLLKDYELNELHAKQSMKKIEKISSSDSDEKFDQKDNFRDDNFDGFDKDAVHVNEFIN
ncbi:dmt family transporter [Anaeramoeba ignava]|uniref:Dmt family transporter n=1 Tax=Anaeramoeba ignava TaxID=1746090 RepID=A0A9Q0R6D8_ANAIG|nr:dmt family transporter [Anaeramoeba ignava]